jgi:hypothetical protein
MIPWVYIFYFLFGCFSLLLPGLTERAVVAAFGKLYMELKYKFKVFNPVFC